MDTIKNLEKITSLIRDNFEAIISIKNSAANISIDEVAQIILMEKYSMSQLEAEEIVKQLHQGLADYSEHLHASETDSEVAFLNEVENATSALSEKERKEALENLLTVLQLSSNSCVDDNTIAENLSINKSKSEDEIISEIRGLINNLPFATLINKLRQNISPESVATLRKTIETSSEEFRMATALQLYILQREGTLKVHDDNITDSIDPHTLGGVAGAAIDMIIATDDLNNGDISLEKWQVIVKYILGALFAISLYLLLSVIMFVTSLAIIDVVAAIFGLGPIAIILGLISSIFFCTVMTYKSCEACEWSLDKLSPIYDKVIVKVTEWVVSVKNAIVRLIKHEENSGTESSNNDESAHVVEEQPIQSDLPIFTEQTPTFA